MIFRRLSVLATAALLVGLIGAAGCNKTPPVEGPGGKTLSLSAPSNQTIRQSEINPIDISITREKFNEPVTIKFADLPKGVKVQDEEMTIAKDKTSTKFNLKADPDAPEVTDQVVSVTATGPDNMTQTKTFKVTVRKKG